MNTSIEILQIITAILVGGIIGLAFGYIQGIARQHNEEKQASGQLKSIWALMPGSGTRVAYLLVGLVLIQLICPMLFKDGVQWWVSGGLVAGYGLMLFKQLRQRTSKAV